MKVTVSFVIILAMLPTPALAQIRLPPPADVPRWVPQPTTPQPSNPNLLPVPAPPPLGRGSNRFLPPPPGGDGSGNLPFVPPDVGVEAPPRAYRAPAPYIPANCNGLEATYGVSIRGGYACLNRPVSTTSPRGFYGGRARGCQNYPGSRRIRIRGGFACF